MSCLRHLRRAAEIYIYIYTRPQTDCRGQVQPRANQCTRTYIYIYVYINTDVLNMRLHLVEIYQNTERSKTFKNTTCSTYHRTCPTYSVRSISRISLLMLLISISSVTGLISKKTQGTTTVCLQVNRFPTMDVRSSQSFPWNRIPVYLPCFVTEHSWTVHWKHFEIVSIVVHRGVEPHSGHYQACLRTGGNRFLTEDWNRTLPCAHTPDLEHDLYLLWFVASTHLTSAWRSLIHCNPFVPFSSSQEP